VRAWLVTSICNASRCYGRVRARSEGLPDAIEEKPHPHLARVVDMWPDQLAARQAFACTTARCQLVLHLLIDRASAVDQPRPRDTEP
jgi:hypothetical protein